MKLVASSHRARGSAVTNMMPVPPGLFAQAPYGADGMLNSSDRPKALCKSEASGPIAFCV